MRIDSVMDVKSISAPGCDVATTSITPCESRDSAEEQTGAFRRQPVAGAASRHRLLSKSRVRR
jgi:hypothetical protein